MFADLLNLTQLDDHEFEAPQSPDTGGRLFGGQFLAQCLMAAYMTMPDQERQAHSLHAYFLRPGQVDLPVNIRVENVRDGRGFSSREVSASQQGKECFRMLSSFQMPETTPEYARPVMPAAAPADDISLTYNEFTLAQTGADDWHGSNRPIDVRYVNPPPATGVVTENQRMWLRIVGQMPNDPAMHVAALAYLSDATLVDHVVLPLGQRWQDGNFDGASLDHAMWFHRPARADEWLMFDQSPETVGRGRGFAGGRLFDISGNLVATCMQEGFVRWHDDAKS